MAFSFVHTSSLTTIRWKNFPFIFIARSMRLEYGNRTPCGNRVFIEGSVLTKLFQKQGMSADCCSGINHINNNKTMLAPQCCRLSAHILLLYSLYVPNLIVFISFILISLVLNPIFWWLRFDVARDSLRRRPATQLTGAENIKPMRCDRKKVEQRNWLNKMNWLIGSIFHYARFLLWSHKSMATSIRAASQESHFAHNKKSMLTRTKARDSANSCPQLGEIEKKLAAPGC